MEEREAEHMEEVAAQFSQLKFVIDTQYANNQTGNPIATSITLGSKELPFLMSIRSFGNLEISSDNCIVDITYNESNKTLEKPYPLGTIKYSSVNGYFLNQEFIYEAGAIITSQSEGNMISIKPSLSQNASGNLSFKIINISGVGGKVSASGYGTTAIQTEFSESSINNIKNVSNIKITTLYPNAWKIFANWALEKILNTNDFWIPDPNPIDNSINIIFNNTIDIEVTYVKVNAQIGPGWVE
jgi:hypothetical protein